MALRRPFCAVAIVWFLAVALIGATPVKAQELGLPDSAILTISSERMYVESAFGKRVARDIEEQGARLAAENRRIEEELGAEEKRLTEQRPTMDPTAFRELADEFDRRVQSVRREQDAKARALTQRREEQQVEFLRAARPILAELMRESGASVILERSSVFLSQTAIDMTDVAISRLDATLGEGEAINDN